MLNMRMRLIVFGAVAAGMVLLLTGCERAKIGEIVADPGRYADREVGVVGTVAQSYSVLGRGVYQVDDGSGKLWVVSEKGVPRKGARVGVKGKIRDGFDLGSLVRLPEPLQSGLVMIESSHRSR